MNQLELDGESPVVKPTAVKKSRQALVPLFTCSLVRDISVKTDSRAVTCAREAVPLLRSIIKDADREYFVVMALSARRDCIGAQVVSIGTLSASLVHPREVFKPAIILNAAAVIVAHNHPSGDPTPSSEDRDVTRRLQRAGELLGIPLADHVIIGAGEQFFSFREHGLL